MEFCKMRVLPIVIVLLLSSLLSLCACAPKDTEMPKADVVAAQDATPIETAKPTDAAEPDAQDLAAKADAPDEKSMNRNILRNNNYF